MKNESPRDEFRVIQKNAPARRAGGKRVFIVKPCLHSEPFRLLDDAADHFKPFVRPVGSFETCARMHEKGMDSLFVHEFHLPLQFLFFQLVIEEPERRGTIIIFLQHIKFHSIFRLQIFF